MTKNWAQFIGKAGMRIQKKKQKCFRDVLYTTLDVEVAGWVAVAFSSVALNYRIILKDEVFLIIGERRNIEVKKADDR